MLKKLLACFAVAMFAFGTNAEAQVQGRNGKLTNDSEIGAVYGMNNGKKVRLSRQVERKVFIEEFTSMGCQNCPLGIIGLEKTQQQYGDKAIIVAAHYQDRLKCGEYMGQVAKIANFPKAHIDRYIKDIHPYYGSGYGESHGFGMGYDIDQALAVAPVAEVFAGGALDGDKLTVKADVKFLFTGDANYSLAFVVTEDGMTHEKWTQRNALIGYRGMGYEDQEPLFDRWVNGTDPMKGIIFDHVAVAAVGIDDGIPGSIPSSVVEEENVSYETVIDLSEYTRYQNKEHFNVIAVLFDNSTGCVANANIIKMTDILAIDGVEADENVTEAARYTIDGRKITAPEKGLNIIKMSDGTTKKVVVK